MYVLVQGVTFEVTAWEEEGETAQSMHDQKESLGVNDKFAVLISRA